jgi:hypothetical protein
VNGEWMDEIGCTRVLVTLSLLPNWVIHLKRQLANGTEISTRMDTDRSLTECTDQTHQDGRNGSQIHLHHLYSEAIRAGVDSKGSEVGEPTRHQ